MTVDAHTRIFGCINFYSLSARTGSDTFDFYLNFCSYITQLFTIFITTNITVRCYYLKLKRFGNKKFNLKYLSWLPIMSTLYFRAFIYIHTHNKYILEKGRS